MPAHKERFFKENILTQIPHKIDDKMFALYTDYAGDHTTLIRGFSVVRFRV